MIASTVRLRLDILHSVLAWAAGQKMIPEVPAFPSVKVPKKKPQPVPAEAVEKLLAKAGGDPELQAYLLCGWLAGLRRVEAMVLEWEPTEEAPYLDLGRDRICFPAEFVKAVEDQWVPLDPELRRALEALPRRGRKVFHFTTAAGTPLDRRSISYRIARLSRRAGVRLTMKSLRRGFGCRYAAKVSAHVLQRLMRHSNIRITMDYYANIDEAVERAVLGDQRNTSRNNPGQDLTAKDNPEDVSPTVDRDNSNPAA
jgi:integrase